MSLPIDGHGVEDLTEWPIEFTLQDRGTLRIRASAGWAVIIAPVTST
jgi:hypothetical protein